jgi:hypothetical protein
MRAEGGRSNVELTTLTGCDWSASSSAEWIRVLTAAGTGSAAIEFEVSSNTGAAREGTLTVADQRLTISQESRPCGYELRSTHVRMRADGGRSNVELTALTGCAWNASSSAEWIRVLTTAGTGSATIEFEVSSNTGAARQGTLDVADQRLVVDQEAAAPPCPLALRSTGQSFDARGGEGRFRVESQAGCQWSASADAPWVTIIPGQRTGSGEVVYAVQTNATTSARSATITVVNATSAVRFTVRQDPGIRTCTFMLAPMALSFPATGGTGLFHVSAEAACLWTALSGALWVEIRGDGSYGTGSADVGYLVLPNTSTSARSTRITVAGQMHTVTQAGIP